MTSTTSERYDQVVILGPLTLKRMTEKAPRRAILILLMGSTGSGKSSFIESFCPNQALSISKNSLDSVTHEVVAYELVNACWLHTIPIILVDTPGFSDSKMSEAKIVMQIQEWIADNNSVYLKTILYCERITDTRMSGSKRRTLQMFKSLAGPDSEKAVTIVTTMWNQIWTDKQMDRAEKRYQQLQDDHWRDYLDQGAQMTKFEMSRTSALEIIGMSLVSSAKQGFAFLRGIPDSTQSVETSTLLSTYMSFVHSSLIDRIANLQLQLQGIEGDLSLNSTSSDLALIAQLQGEKALVCSRLQSFQQDMALILERCPSLSNPHRTFNSVESPSDPFAPSSSRVRILSSKNTAHMPQATLPSTPVPPMLQDRGRSLDLQLAITSNTTVQHRHSSSPSRSIDNRTKGGIMGWWGRLRKAR